MQGKEGDDEAMIMDDSCSCCRNGDMGGRDEGRYMMAVME